MKRRTLPIVIPAVVLGALLSSAQNYSTLSYTVNIYPNKSERVAFPFENPGYANLYLTPAPKSGYSQITDSKIVFPWGDDVLWRRLSKTHYAINSVIGYSSREHVVIEGHLGNPPLGGGGEPPNNPKFKVTVPTVNISWESQRDETIEDTYIQFCPLTPDKKHHQIVEITYPRDDVYPLHPIVTVKWNWGNAIRLVWAHNGAPFPNGGTIDFSQNLPSTRFRVEPLAVTHQPFEIRVEGRMDSQDGRHYRDRIPMDKVKGMVIDCQLLADTNRDGSVTVEDAEGKAEWAITRGTLIPPRKTDANTLPAHTAALLPHLPQVRVVGQNIPFGLTGELSADAPDFLSLYNTDGTPAAWNAGKIPLPFLPTNFHVSATAARTPPDAVNLSLTLFTSDKKPVLPEDTVRLKVAPLILPPECNPATVVYSTRAIPGLASLVIPVDGNVQWTQDMAKFPKVQFNDAGFSDVALDLGYVRDDIPNHGVVHCSYTLTTNISQRTPMLRTDWSVGGQGGNIMATPPLPDAPYGKLMIGNKWPASVNNWIQQNIQPVINIDTSWLVTGHVDELFMWIAPNKVIYADPWIAADLLHQGLLYNNIQTVIWCGLTAASMNNTIGNVAIDTLNTSWKADFLPVALPATGASVTVTFTLSVFAAGDYLRVGNEILKVDSVVNGNQYLLLRAQAGRPATAHAANDVIYALSPLMRKNLLGINNTPSVVTRIGIVTNQLRTALGNYSADFIPVPVLFDDEVVLAGKKYPLGEFAAVTANLANCLVVNQNQIYYSDPGIAAFRNYFQQNVMAGASAVNVWEDYHCNGGEIHCGTAAVRLLLPDPPWWNQNVIKTKWGNEK